MKFISEKVKKLRPTPQLARNSTRTLHVRRVFSRGLSNFDADLPMERIGQEVMKRLKAGVQRAAFSKKARRRLAKALKIQVKGKSVLVFTADPLWNYLVNGRKKQPMVWLKKANVAIPIVTDSGDLLFRKPTAKSFSGGKWVFPGREPLSLAEQAVKEARKFIKRVLMRNLDSKVRRSI